jgi:hypothetical protein
MRVIVKCEWMCSNPCALKILLHDLGAPLFFLTLRTLSLRFDWASMLVYDALRLDWPGILLRVAARRHGVNATRSGSEQQQPCRHALRAVQDHHKAARRIMLRHALRVRHSLAGGARGVTMCVRGRVWPAGMDTIHPCASAVYDFSDGGVCGWDEANAASWFRPESICTCSRHYVLHVEPPQHLGAEADPQPRGASDVDVMGEETAEWPATRRGISPRVSALSFSICCGTLWGRNVRRETPHIRSRKQPPRPQNLHIVLGLVCAVWQRGGGGGGPTMKIPQTGLGVARRLVMPWKAKAGQRTRQAFSRMAQSRLKRASPF